MINQWEAESDVTSDGAVAVDVLAVATEEDIEEEMESHHARC